MEIKDQIVAGSWELFMRFGIKSITMDEIASHLSMSKKTIYQHYPDKDALVVAVVMLAMAQEHCKWQELGDKAEDVIDEMRMAATLLREMAGKMNSSLLFDMRKYHPKAWATFQDCKKEYIYSNIMKTIERGKSEGYFRQNVHADIITKLRMQEVEMAFDPSMFPTEKYDLVEVHLQLFEHFMYGIATLKGHQRMNELKQIND